MFLQLVSVDQQKDMEASTDVNVPTIDNTTKTYISKLCHHSSHSSHSKLNHSSTNHQLQGSSLLMDYSNQ